MNFVLGFTDGDWINILFGVMALAIPALFGFLRYKAKSDKADIKSDVMKDVEAKIHEEIEPINKRMEKHDVEFKEFKRDEITPMKEDVNKLITQTELLNQSIGTMIKGQEKIESHIGKIFSILTSKQDKK